MIKHDTKYTNIIYTILLKLTCMLLFGYKYKLYMYHKYYSSLYGIVTNELFMDSGFEDKQNRVLLVMTRKGIYMCISYI